MVDLRPISATLIMLQALFATPAAAQDAELKGESKSLGLKFESESADWCAPRVGIRLDVADPEFLRGQGETLQQALGKIRAIIDGDCPSARVVAFTGYHAKKLVSYGEMMRAGQWIYRPFPLLGGEPNCQGEPKPDFCQRRWAAFKLMRQFGLDERFKDLELTRYLKTDDGPDLEFTYGTVKGRVLVHPIPAGQPAPDPKAVVEAQIRKQAKSCRTGAQVTNTDTFPNGIFSQGLICKDGGSAYVHFLGGMHGGNFVMLAATDAADPQKGEELAWRMAAVANTAFKSGSDLTAFRGVECATNEDGTAGGSMTVAIELLKVSDNGDGVEFAVRDGARPSPDRWRMSARAIPQDVRRLLSASPEGPWATYRTVRTPSGIKFRSRVYARDGEGCRQILEEATVDATSIPTSAVNAFAKLSGIDRSRDDADLRRELRIWAATQF